MDLVTLPLDLIDPPIVVIREDLLTEGFQELVADIREHGILQPLIVRPVAGRYRLVAGYRRWRAAQRAELLEVPCSVQQLDDTGEVEVMMRENLHRENPNPAEEGKMFAVLHEGCSLSYAGIAQRVGKSEAYVTARLALVRGPENVREAVRDGHISFSVGLELLRCTHEADRDNLLYHAMHGGCTTTVMRGWVTEAVTKRAAQPAGADPQASVVSLEAPPLMTGACEWHEALVPLDLLMSFRVCAVCYRALTVLREDMKTADAAAEAEAHHVDGQKPPDTTA